MGAVTSEDVASFCSALSAYSRVLILTHDNPDPDALAAAAGLRLLVKRVAHIPALVGYSGFLSRPENREMVSVLRLRAKHLSEIDMRRFRALVLVDTQPGAGNNSLSDRQTPVAVIDHHALRRASQKCAVQFVDPACGATSTLVYEMLRVSGLTLPTNIATALFYGIKTDTLDLGREATDRDEAAYKELFDRSAHRKLALITHPRLPRVYYLVVTQALASAATMGDCVYAPIGDVPTPEYVSTIADYLIALQGMRWAVATGCFQGNTYVSLRTLTARKNAGRILRKAIGAAGYAGGHQKMAGGIILSSNLEADKRAPAEERIMASLFAALGINPSSSEPLLRPVAASPQPQ